MAIRSLNPHAAENASTPRLPGKGTEPQAPRRNFLVAFFAGAIGTLIALFPFGAGVLTFLDPLLRKKPQAEGGRLLRVGQAAAVPADGTPVQMPVIADLTDGWNREPNQPIGAVYLRRDGDKIICYNAICPHAGCFIGFDDGRRCFQCPCHTSSFALDGSVMHPSPSPRDMDPLEIDAEKLKLGEVWVRFENYYPGKAEREPKK